MYVHTLPKIRLYYIELVCKVRDRTGVFEDLTCMDYLTPIIDTLRETHASYMRVVGDIMFAWNIFTRVSRFHVKLCKSWSLQEGCSNSKTYNNTPLLNCTCVTSYLVTNFSLKGLEFYASAASACRKVCCARNCCREYLA